MAEDQKLALKQLQKYLISLIRDLEANGLKLDLEEIETDDFEYSLKYSKKSKLTLIKGEKED